MKGIVAAGHHHTAESAREILNEGGNAFDAALAALCAATVCEPVLASLGGGGFLLADGPGIKPRIFDFFVQTPKRRRPPDEIDFRPITADFGAVTQEFHTGPGAIATPGVAAGLFAVHRELGRMPLRRIVEPALALARNGITMNRLQAYVLDVVSPIYVSDPKTLAHYGSASRPGRLLVAGDLLLQPQLADVLETLAIEGEGLFYRGEIAAALLGITENGGFLTREDLEGYRVAVRAPLSLRYRDRLVLTNPPPSTGGILIAFALQLLERQAFGAGDAAYALLIARAMAAAERVREECREGLEAILDEALLARYVAEIRGKPQAQRGTTHISVIDGQGNAASLTLSNGEGCGHLIPGAGIMPNNMLGEEDLNPGGFHRWPADRRMVSMMAPTLVLSENGDKLVTGSGGSNRIRSAILQLLINRIDRKLPLVDAVHAPRIHLEKGLLSIEGGHTEAEIRALSAAYPENQCWDEINLFFGGAHSVESSRGGLEGAGDPRRDGVCMRVDAR